jgi:hypothetical protein
MNLLRLIAGNPRKFCIGLLGVLAWTSGCDGVGWSNPAPVAPPPGASAKDIQDAMKKAYGPKGIPKPTRPAPNHKAR